MAVLHSNTFSVAGPLTAPPYHSFFNDVVSDGSTIGTPDSEAAFFYDTGVNDHKFSIEVATNDAAADFNIELRRSATGWVQFRLQEDEDNPGLRAFVIREYWDSGESDADRDSQPAQADFSPGDVFRAEVVGTAARLYRNGALVASGTLSQTLTGTIAGMGWAGTTFRFDNELEEDFTPSSSVALAGFRFYNDDGDEDGSTAAAAQDTNLSAATAVNKILRLQLQATNDPDSIAFTLRAQKNGSGGYTAVPVGATTITTPTQPTSATVTTVGTAADPWTINRATASAGDMVVFVLAWDDSTTVTSVTPPSGPNGETAVSIAGPVASNGTEMRMQAWYYIATGSWSAGTLSFDPSASETVRAVSFAIPAAQFNASDPIGWSNTAASAGTAESTINSPTGTAESNDGSGRLFIAYGSDADAITAPASGTTTVNNATGGGVGLCVVSRDTVVSNSESVANITASIASDSWASLAFVVKPNVVNNEIYVSPSTNITAGGEATTQRLTGGTGSFTTGRIWDDENGIDGIDIGDGNNTEIAWCLQLAASLSPGDYFDLLPYNGETALTGTAARITVQASTGNRRRRFLMAA